MKAKASSTKTPDRIAADDTKFLDRVRGFSILRVVLVHLGLSWFFPPYSQFIHVFLPLLFFVSGAVSFFSFKRAPSILNYTLRRTFSIVMPYYVIVVAAFIFLWVRDLSLPNFNFISLLNWVTIDPASSEMPFPMGQIWFIHAMAIIIFISLPVFLVSRKTSLPLLLVALTSVMLSIFHQIYDIDNFFSIFGHNFYQAFSNIGFFLLGAFYYSAKQIFSTEIILSIIILLLVSMIFQVAMLNVDLNMANHTYAPDFYYLSGSFLVIFVVLLCKPLIEKFLKKINILDWFFLFLGRHAYSVFMLHSLVLFLVEKYLGLVNVATNLPAALLKIFLVVILSCFIAVPVTKFSKLILKIIQGLIRANPSAKDVECFDTIKN
jgi:peptidoglycan/LPS O-acetylase OafA/YrhL